MNDTTSEACPRQTPWCVDHRREMIGEFGECHGERRITFGSDELPTIDSSLSLFDGDEEPTAFIVVLAPDGEHFARVNFETLDGLASAIEHFGDQFRDVLTGMRDETRAVVPA